MQPPINRSVIKIDKKAAIILFEPQDSNFFDNGSRINAIKKANAIGISTVFAKIRIANRPIIVAIT